MNWFQRFFVGSSFVLMLIGCGALAYVATRHDDEAYLRKLLYDEQKHIAEPFFSPDDQVRDILISLISCEQKRIRIAIYTITDKRIARALIDAYDNGVEVECVVDPAYKNDRYSKVPLLLNAGIPIWVYQSSQDRNGSLMHNKWALFDDNFDHKALVWTGSYNFTVRANDANQENVVILDAPRVFAGFAKQYELLKNRSIKLEGSVDTRKRPRERGNQNWVKKLRALF
jgi:mitochondrial cardiolipin hydrolase